MNESLIKIRALIVKASEVIAPLWPMQTIIARNPLQGLEEMAFEDAISRDESLQEIRQASEVDRELIKWCQVFLDEGQATFPMPDREKGFYGSWKTLAPFDNRLNLNKNKQWLSHLPERAEEAIILCLKKLKIQPDQWLDYFQSSLSALPGWAGYIKWRADWQNKELGKHNPIDLTDYLAVRLALTCALDARVINHPGPLISKNERFFTDLKNRETAFASTLVKSLLEQPVNGRNERPIAQIVFCIDVRSEPFRKCMEELGHYETFGCAGFFGLPVSFQNKESGHSKECCPVLVKPQYQVIEEFAQRDSRLPKRSWLQTAFTVYHDLKYNFGTPFALVETLGVWFGLWMGMRTVFSAKSVKLRKAVKEILQPSNPTRLHIPIPLADQIALAESALKIIGMTHNFSPLVVFCGHKSQTENNPYASALDCGACGGNHGGQNARLMASILNNQDVRRALVLRGIEIPNETLFIGGEHNTTTDEVSLEDSPLKQPIHQEIVSTLKSDFTKAALAHTQWRLSNLHVKNSSNSSKDACKRACDWSEVRPEWGLARNAAFIVGSRNLTKGIKLDGRCFLHSYDWKKDAEGKLLETILTAPVVVAEWINTQYFFSTFNNAVYGSGSKITHNVTGRIGVMQGNGSDLMQGLPLQSVNLNDDQSYHELMRLQVIVHAPCMRLDKIIAQQPILKKLIFNEWIHLIAIDPLDRKAYRLVREGDWVEFPEPSSTLLYSGKTGVIATMHEKEQAIAPAFLDILGLKCLQVKIDTDSFGTFTGEVERRGTPLECARKKCERALAESGDKIAIASEGSFGSHPYIPFAACDHEILYFMDQERGFTLHQTLLSTQTNYCAEVMDNREPLALFCSRAQFPSHGLILRPHQPKEPLIVKGIQTQKALEEAFATCQRLSDDGKVIVETDMRAHMNPTRMRVIGELAASFAKRLATLCPNCQSPGWGMLETIRGLECELCGSETEMVKLELYGCPTCKHKEQYPRKDGLALAEPQYCGWCNP